MNVRQLVILALAAFGLVACAANPSGAQTLEQRLAERNYQLGEPVERILQYRLDGWNYLDRQHLIMQTEPSKYYLVSLTRPCYNLSAAEHIAFTTTVNQLTRFDKLLVRGPDRRIEHCYIDTLNALNKVKKEAGES